LNEVKVDSTMIAGRGSLTERISRQSPIVAGNRLENAVERTGCRGV